MRSALSGDAAHAVASVFFGGQLSGVASHSGDDGISTWTTGLSWNSA
jgi:hypothetical protein